MWEVDVNQVAVEKAERGEECDPLSRQYLAASRRILNFNLNELYS